MTELFNLFSKDSKNKEIKKTGFVGHSDEQMITKLNSGEFNLVLDNARYPLNSLTSIFQDYNLEPEYQRQYIWDVQRKSRLIESFVANIPVPPIFLYESDYNKYEVMDGLQRISTIIEYFNNKFELKGLELWPELNGKTFAELLPDFQSAIKRRYLSAIIVVKESNNKKQADLLKTYTFERLNTGGINLSAQEIRNAVYLGPVNDVINDIGHKNDLFLQMYNFGNKTSDMVDRLQTSELVLRFFAYKDALNNHVDHGTKKVLDEYTKRASIKNDEFAEQLRKYFESVITIINNFFGEGAFSRKNKFEKMIFDTVMLGISDLYDDDVDLTKCKYDSIRNNELKNKYLMDQKRYFNGKYTSLSKVNQRVKLFKSFICNELLGN
ncbi:DUF262 domain-containing protein [Fructobacillus sp. M158]|uniref:DUF262 domain-containing protein n=1 Tax=Fructobacillus parabroussonetiae TaxID=2713174 RepID=UPI00200B3F91|nr:DUF262 domain-containing protein [Fructobacillus parabroussonetiae]MCK8616825.1 DUF262 domain-containing protein [Fructobacillus parabroussonetiae]